MNHIIEYLMSEQGQKECGEFYWVFVFRPLLVGFVTLVLCFLYSFVKYLITGVPQW